MAMPNDVSVDRQRIERTMDRLVVVHRVREDLELQAHPLSDLGLYADAARLRCAAARLAVTEARLRNRLIHLLDIPPAEVWDAVSAWGR